MRGTQTATAESKEQDAVASTATVSGRAFLGLIRHVKEKWGAQELAEVVTEAGPGTQRVFDSRILHSGSYGYDAYVQFLTALERRYGKWNPDFARELGQASGVRDINTVFRIYLALASPERLIRSCSKVWPSYYENAGQMEAITWAPEDTRVRISGFPQMAPIHCRLMEGWMIATMATLGLEVRRHPEARDFEVACMSRGGPHHEFRCTWAKKR